MTVSGLQSFLCPSSMRRLVAVLCCLVIACGSLPGQRAMPGQGEKREQARKARVERLLAGRRVAGGRTSAEALEAARRQHLELAVGLGTVGPRTVGPRNTILSAPWTAVGPAQVASPVFGNLTGRVTALAVDPADASGNTLYVGTTGGGVWKSVNAAGPAAAVVFTPLTDTLPVFSGNAGSAAIPSLSIGALTVANGVVLAGTGDTNDATDSYYGGGILRSADGGNSWTLVQSSTDGAAGNHTLVGLGFAQFAVSSANPALVVAAASTAAEGAVVNAPNAQSRVQGLYYSADAGLSWHLATLMDGNVVTQSTSSGSNAATAVVWNPVRRAFFAAVQYHGYYSSADGMTWSRLAQQPGAGLTTVACPAAPASSACPIFRGALAVQPVTGDLFALTVDAGNHDTGLYQDVCALSGTGCANTAVQFGSRLNGAPLEVGSGSNAIAQGSYNLALAALPVAGDTVLFAGTIDLYRCSLAAGCALRDTTNAENGCLHPAGVAPAQHALAAGAGAMLYLGNDGGVYRTSDGAAETGPACSAGDVSHFDNLNGGLGSLAEVVTFAQDPASATTLLAGLGAIGSAGTGTATGAWPQLSAGEGGEVAIDQATPVDWYVSTNAGVSIARCSKGAGCGAADFVAPTVGEAQVANDVAAIHAPWLLDPAATNSLVIGTCRAWRGPADSGALWSSSNAISRPFGAAGASGCSATLPVVRALAAGGPAAGSGNFANLGSTVLYAGLAGALDGGGALGGHVFTTFSANVAGSTTVWTDAAHGAVTNDQTNAGVFNPGGFDVSSLAADPHDATGKTVYATIMGFAANGVAAPHLYRSSDGGGHWLDISSNLPDAPVNSAVVDPNDANTVYVANDTGVYVTTQITTCASANCWSVYGTQLPNAPAMQLLAAAAMPTGDGRVGELRVGTYGRGIWQIPLLTAMTAAAPQILLVPNTVTFATQQTGTLSQPVTVTVTNTGSANLFVTGIVTSSDFVESDNCTGAAIVQGASCAVQVRFQPAGAGSRSGLLTVYGNVAGGQATAVLSGMATPPATIVLTPASLSFPATSLGSTSVAGNITVANTGGSAAALQMPVISGDFRISANSCGGSLAPQNSCTVSVVFAPAASGNRTGTLTLVDDAGTQVAALTGLGTTPATDALAPGSLVFGAQQIGSASALQSVTLSNAGDVALTLIAASITSGDFSVVNGCGSSLNAHATCVFQVAYVPKAVGAGAGVLAVSDQFRTQTVALAGTGLAPPGVSLSPAGGLQFGAAGVGMVAPAQTITLTNNGGVALAIGGIAATGDFALLAGGNTCPAMLAPAAACSVAVVFNPTLAGMRSGTVTFSDNAGNSAQTIALSGTGIDFTLMPDGPTSMTIANGQSATYTLLLSSQAGLAGTVAFSCSGKPAHSLCTVNPGTGALGGTTVVTVTVATGVAGAAMTPPVMPWSRPALWLAFALPLLLVRRRRFASVLTSLIATALVLGGLTACGTPRTIPGASTTSPVAPVVTPSGTTTLVVTGTSAGLARAVSLTLVVQ